MSIQYYVSLHGSSMMNVTERIEQLEKLNAELLAACEMALPWIEPECTQTKRVVREAIAKAKEPKP